MRPIAILVAASLLLVSSRLCAEPMAGRACITEAWLPAGPVDMAPPEVGLACPARRQPARVRMLSQDDRIACAPDRYREVLSLAALPMGIPAALRGVRDLDLDLLAGTDPLRGGAGLAELSDRGGPFNGGDVGGGPRRRFVLAAAGGHRTVVAVEQGGVGYGVEVWNFERGAAGWVGNEVRRVGRAPSTAQELVDDLCSRDPH